jgi:PEP-CTERM motif
MIVNGNLNAIVALAGSLRGSGSIAGSVVALNGSLVSPGNSAGTLTLQNLTLDLGAMLEIEVSKATAGFPPVAGFDYDTLFATNTFGGLSPTVTLGGSLSLTVGTGIEQNDVFSIIINTSTDPVVGTFAGLPSGALLTVGGQAFQISYADDSNTPAFELAGGNDVSLLAVPEPGAVVLLLGGLAACSLGRRRERATA